MAAPKLWYLASGQRVQIYQYDAGGNHPIHGAYEATNQWIVCAWTSTGLLHEGKASNLDLVGLEKYLNK